MRAVLRKGGQQHDWFPPFETHRYAVLLRVRILLVRLSLYLIRPFSL